jgi:hypothetical protein
MSAPGGFNLAVARRQQQMRQLFEIVHMCVFDELGQAGIVRSGEGVD